MYHFYKSMIDFDNVTDTKVLEIKFNSEMQL